MLVETFECAETSAEPIEATEEALSLIESLGLKGQAELTAKRDDGFASRCPYREITAEETFVYRTLCPRAVALQNYKESPIPLRVLQVAAHASSLNMFKRLIVWDRESVAVKDPVLVAHTGGEYDWQNNNCFILARWGEELETFVTLLKRAVAIKREQLYQEAQRLVGQIQNSTDAEILKAGFAGTIVEPWR